MTKGTMFGFGMLGMVVFILALRVTMEAKKRNFYDEDEWDSDLCSCGYPRITNPTTVIVWGHEVQLTKSPHCVKCAENYLEQYSTCCESCCLPILPGQNVAIGVNQDRYTHASYNCNPMPSMIAGHWGEGKLVEHEFH